MIFMSSSIRSLKATCRSVRITRLNGILPISLSLGSPKIHQRNLGKVLFSPHKIDCLTRAMRGQRHNITLHKTPGTVLWVGKPSSIRVRSPIGKAERRVVLFHPVLQRHLRHHPFPSQQLHRHFLSAQLINNAFKDSYMLRDRPD